MAGEETGVGGEVETIGIAEARSALAWWLDAGVDAAIQEQPRNWLKTPAPEKPAPAQPLPEPNVTQPSHETLGELQEWLATSAHLPLASATARRILPHGPENAAVMLLCDVPVLEDYTARRPIGGEAWELAQRMLAAIGIAPEQAYCASLSPIHAPGMRLTGRDREDCAAIAPPRPPRRSASATAAWRRPIAGASRKAARPGARPRPQDRRRPRGRDLPSTQPD